ncbi:MAG: hypothetical protein ACREE7_00110 [Dongiaceae bacterium]
MTAATRLSVGVAALAIAGFAESALALPQCRPHYESEYSRTYLHGQIVGCIRRDYFVDENCRRLYAGMKRTMFQDWPRYGGDIEH